MVDGPAPVNTSGRGPDLIARGLAVNVGGRLILRPQTLDWTGPGLVCVVGRNGSGKTTLLKALAGLLKLHDGELTLDGLHPGDRGVRSTIAYCPAAPVLFEDMTLIAQCEYVARVHRAALSSRWWELADALGVNDDLLARRPAAFSSGERQKSSLLLSLARPFRLGVLDEPSTSLDRTVVSRLAGWLVEQSRTEGQLFVVASHETALAAVAGELHTVEEPSP